MRTIQAINPATEELIVKHDELNNADLNNRLEMAAEAFRAWRTTSFSQRAERMGKLAEILRQQKDSLAKLSTQEMGKPIAQAESEIDKCAWVCDYYAENAERFLRERAIETDADKSYVRYDPLGPVLAIMPWNFPFWQVFRFAAPTIMAGNVGVLKHASNVPGVALKIEELFSEAGFPAAVMSSLLISPSKIENVISHDAIQAVTLTGSDRAGAKVGEQAGKQIKKAVLELGGSDPFIVLADADPQQAAQQAAKARILNSGQSCIAAKRFIVEQPIAEPFADAMTYAMEQLKAGDPMDRSNDLGPMARDDLRDKLHDQVHRSVQSGARLRTGGERLSQKGYYYAPTLLDQVEPGMPAFDEETFGPVAAVIEARDRDHAVEIANQSKFGLGACVVTGDAAQGKAMASEIEAGNVFINGMVKSDPRLPFGGVKRSGHGRELSDFGIREFVNVKTVWMNESW